MNGSAERAVGAVPGRRGAGRGRSPRLRPRPMAVAVLVLAAGAGALLLVARMGGRPHRVPPATPTPPGAAPAAPATSPGDADSAYRTACRYDDGDVVPPDAREALRWYEAAAGLGHPKAMCVLGWKHQFGRGVARDPARAFAWYEKSAAAGDPEGMRHLAGAYEWGVGTAADGPAAERWYRRAMDLGDADAAVGLGAMYLEGRGVPQDVSSAFRLIRQGADAGSGKGLYVLGVINERGLGGRPVNVKTAVSWYRQAAERGVAPAAEALARLGEPAVPAAAPAAADRSLGPTSRPAGDDSWTRWDLGAGVSVTLPDDPRVRVAGGSLVLPVRNGGGLGGVSAVVLVAVPAGGELALDRHPVAAGLQALFDADTQHPAQALSRGPFTFEAKDLDGTYALARGHIRPAAGGPTVHFWARGEAEAAARLIGVVRQNMSVAPAAAGVDADATGRGGGGDGAAQDAAESALSPEATVAEFLRSGGPQQQAVYRRLALEWLDRHSRAEPAARAALRELAAAGDVPGLDGNVRRLVERRPELAGLTVRQLVHLMMRQAEGW